MLDIVFGILFFGLSLYLYLTWHFHYWMRRGVVGPKPYPYVGTFPKTALLDKNSNYMNETSEIYRKYYRKHRFVGVFECREPKLLILDPILVADIYVKYFKHFSDNSMSEMVNAEKDPLFKPNPFIATGATWKERRTELAPAFTMSKVKCMYPAMENSCRQLIDFIDNRIQSGQTVLASRDICSRVIADSLCTIMYGLDAKAFDDHSDFVNHSLRMLHKPQYETIRTIISSIFPILKRLIPDRFVSEEFNQWFQALHAHAVQLRKENNITRDDYLNFLLELQKRKNHSTILSVANAFTFFIDGFETTSYILGNAINELAKSEECQKKLRTEVRNHEYIGFDDLNQMPYLDAVFNETTRICPFPFPIWKTCTEDIELSDFDGRIVHIEKGTKIILPTTALHNHPGYYANPEKFDPDRYITHDIKTLKEGGVFIPFGNGPRICMDTLSVYSQSFMPSNNVFTIHIGMRFASAQIKAVLCALVNNFEFSVKFTPNKPSGQAGLLFFSDNPVELEFKRNIK